MSLPDKEQLSECCNAEMFFHPEMGVTPFGGKTSYYTCSNCHGECYPHPPTQEPKEECVFESDGEKHSCIDGCDGIVENCRKCHRDICSNPKCPLGKGKNSQPPIPTQETEQWKKEIREKIREILNCFWNEEKLSTYVAYENATQKVLTIFTQAKAEATKEAVKTILDKWVSLKIPNNLDKELNKELSGFTVYLQKLWTATKNS
jgi:hypothetical protein